MNKSTILNKESMKTQISNLRSGTKNQFLNPSIDYTNNPEATSHNGHVGSSIEDVQDIWSKVIFENPNEMKAIINGIELSLKANWSLSGKTVTYTACITNEQLQAFDIAPTKEEIAFVQIQSANIITVSNGKKGQKYICPSLVTIL
jgi:hypothetical protein